MTEFTAVDQARTRGSHVYNSEYNKRKVYPVKGREVPDGSSGTATLFL